MIEQLIIAILGIASIWLVNDPRTSHQRWACVLGLVAQPFWILVSWQANQWGIFALSIAYAAAWLRGFWRHWIAAPQPRSKANVITITRRSKQLKEGK